MLYVSLIFHLRQSHRDKNVFLFFGACLHCTSPWSGNRLGRVGLIISAMFLNLLLPGIIKPLGKTLSQDGSEYRIFSYSWIILRFEGILGSSLVLHAEIPFLLDFFSPNKSSLLLIFLAFKKSFLVLSTCQPLHANCLTLSSITWSKLSSELQIRLSCIPTPSPKLFSSVQSGVFYLMLGFALFKWW